MSSRPRVVLASHNPSKVREMLDILRRAVPSVEFFTLAEFPGAPEPEETGDTYAENAAIKAESAFRHCGIPAIADDAGLEVAALGGAPGVYSKRFGGAELRFPDKQALLLERLDEALGAEPEVGRAARFRCLVALAGIGPNAELFEATCEGEIAHAPAGAGGFGYDPIFYLPSLGRTMAQLSAAEKNGVSHRGKVLAAVAERLRALSAEPSP